MARKFESRSLEAEIARLPDLGLAELRARWKALYGRPASKFFRRKLLVRAVAYQMQVNQYGGLSEATKRRLREIAAAARDGTFDPVMTEPRIKPGTKLIRTWKKTTHARYLELGAVAELEDELARRKLRTRAFTSAGNKAWGNRPFSRGHLFRILSNSIYAGKIAHKDKQYEGQHEAIIKQKTFDAVQAQLAANNRQYRTRSRAKEPNLLAGLLVDTKGVKLTSSHAVKDGKRYRYYVGTRTEQGQSKPWRLPAHDIETAVVGELQRFLGDRGRIASALTSQRLKTHDLKEALWAAKQLGAQIGQTTIQRETILKLVKQVVVSESDIAVEIKLAALMPDGAALQNKATYRLKMPVELMRRNGETAVIAAGSSGHEAKHDPALIKALARGFTWLEELAEGRADTVTAIAKRDGVTDRYVSQLIELAFLSPQIVEKVLSGTGGMRVSTKQLVFDIELGPLWSEQERVVFTPRS